MKIATPHGMMEFNEEAFRLQRDFEANLPMSAKQYDEYFKKVGMNARVDEDKLRKDMAPASSKIHDSSWLNELWKAKRGK